MKQDDIPGDSQDVCSFFAGLINQRQSVERLLNWLRESQTTCTDTNCFNDLTGLPGSEQGSPLLDDDQDSYASDGEPLQLVMMFLVGVLALYAFNITRGRNAARRLSKSSSSTDQHPRRREDDDDNTRPTL